MAEHFFSGRSDNVVSEQIIDEIDDILLTVGISNEMKDQFINDIMKKYTDEEIAKYKMLNAKYMIEIMQALMAIRK